MNSVKCLSRPFGLSDSKKDVNVILVSGALLELRSCSRSSKVMCNKIDNHTATFEMKLKIVNFH